MNDYHRLGVRWLDKVRPVKFSLPSTDHFAQVLKNTRRLRAEEGSIGVFNCPSRTVDDKKAFKWPWEQFSGKKKGEPNKVHQI